MVAQSSQETKVQIREANLFSIEPNASIALLGKRRTGKTTWAKYILYHLQSKIDRFVALCGNKDNASEWKRVINPLFVMDKSIKFLEALRDYQDMRVSKYSQENLPIPKKYQICVILDDCGSDKSFMFSRIMRDMLSNGRHYGMTVIILAQYLNQMHSENRDQIDYLGMLYTSNLRNLKKVQEEYVNVSNLRTFKCVLNACAADKGMCWIDNTANPEKIEECVFFKRMDMETVRNMSKEENKLGSKHVKKYALEHYFDPTETNAAIATQIQNFMHPRRQPEQEEGDGSSEGEEDTSWESGRERDMLTNLEALSLFKKNWMAKGQLVNNTKFTDNQGVITVTKTPYIPKRGDKQKTIKID